MKIKSLKVLIVGAGRIAGTYELDKFRKKPCTHIGAFKKNKNFNVKGIVDTKIKKGIQFSKKFKIQFFLKIEEALKKIKPDLVSIAVPDHQHLKVLKSCVKSKFKPKLIFCEKPISNNLINALKMHNLAKKSGINLFVNNRRLDPTYLHIKNLLKKNYNNQVVSFSAYCSSGINTLGSHVIDLIRYIFGEVEYVISLRDPTVVNHLAHSENFTNSDPRISSLIRLKKDITGFFMCSAKLKYSYFEIEILTKKGKIRISDNGKNIKVWKLRKPGLSVLSHTLKREKNQIVNKRHTLFENLAEYIYLNKENYENVISSGEALKSYKVINAMIKSSKNNKKIYV